MFENQIVPTSLPYHSMIREKAMRNLITYFPRAEFASDAYRKCNNVLLA